MSVSPSASPQRPRRRPSRELPLSRWLDVLAFLAWGVLILRYWLTGKLDLLIHPNYRWLAISTGIVLVGIGVFRALQLRQQSNQTGVPALSHISLFPRGVSSALLLLTAIFGMVIEPQAFTSQTALQRGVSDYIPLSRSQPQAFHGASRPEERSLVEWIRTLNVYPEPDEYAGQKVNVIGFVIPASKSNLPEEYLTIARFVITCCAADAYPVGLPVKLPDSNKNYPADEWFQVEGTMIVETFNNRRQLTIEAKSLKSIEAPDSPYEF